MEHEEEIEKFIKLMHEHFYHLPAEKVVLAALAGLDSNARVVADLSFDVSDELFLALIKARENHNKEWYKKIFEDKANDCDDDDIPF